MEVVDGMVRKGRFLYKQFFFHFVTHEPGHLLVDGSSDVSRCSMSEYLPVTMGFLGGMFRAMDPTGHVDAGGAEAPMCE